MSDTRVRRRCCCVCGSNPDKFSSTAITWHSFPEQGKSFVPFQVNDLGFVVKKDRLTVWSKFAEIPEAETKSKFICSLHFKPEDYDLLSAGYDKQGKMLRRLKTTAVPSVKYVANSQPPANFASLSTPIHQNQAAATAMQTESIIRPPEMLCAIYSLPDANPAELDTQDTDGSSESCDNNTQNLDSTEDTDSFYSRCLLCTCRPDATPHLRIFSNAGNELQLSEKLNKYLNIQIQPGLPQRVCQTCLEKLEVTHELTTSSQRARILLLQIKEQGEIFDFENPMDDDNQSTVGAFEHVDIQSIQHFKIKTEKEDSMEFDYAEKDSDSYQLAEDAPAIDNPYTIDVIPMDQEDSDTNSSVENFDQPAIEDNEPTQFTIPANESTRKSAEVEKPGLFGCTGGDGPSDKDFIQCVECSQTIFKGYMAFHVKTHHGELKPAEFVDKPIQQRERLKKDVLLDVIKCSFCQLQFSSQVMDLHVSLRHTRKTYEKELPETGVQRLIQCPACPCMFYPESMQGHIAEEHPPRHNPDLDKTTICSYCGMKLKYRDMDRHLKTNHGLNAWTRCIHCRKRIRNTDTDIEVHLFQHHPGGILLKCRICDRRYASTGKEQAHMQTFLSCKYKCPLQNCRKTFVTSSSFKDHVLFFHPKIEEELQAEIKTEIYEVLGLDQETGDVLENQNEESDDIEIEEIIPPPLFTRKKIIVPASELKMPKSTLRPRYDYGGTVECDICKQLVKHKWYLVQHKNSVHNMNLTYDCLDCGKKYPAMDNIMHHLHGVHGPKDHKCDICGELFTKTRFRAHLKWHKRLTPAKPPRNLLDRPLDPVRCGMCNRPARNKLALLTHINAEHLDVVGERLPFHCEPCNREFANYEYLMQHNYSKHLPKIVCTYCGKLVTQNRMSMHLKIHEPDRGSDYKGKKRGRKPSKAVK